MSFGLDLLFGTLQGVLIGLFTSIIQIPLNILTQALLAILVPPA